MIVKFSSLKTVAKPIIYLFVCVFVPLFVCMSFLSVYLFKDSKKDKNLQIILKSKLITLGLTVFPV